jgi:two-component system CheB/CheR fusion protein
MLCHALERSGFQTRHAADGAAALAVAAGFDPDVVLLDIGLPSRSGVDVASALRGSPGGADMRIVALTGRDAADVSDGGEFDDWLTRPTSLERLCQLLS